MNVSVIIDQKDLRKNILSEIVKRLNAICPHAEIPIKKELGDFIKKMILDTPEVKSISDYDGQLRRELGLENGKNDIEQIIDVISKNIFYKYTPFSLGNNGIIGGIQVGFIQDDHMDVLSLPVAKYMSNQYNIEWLEWLLKAGFEIINYSVRIFPDIQPASRTDYALMVESPGQLWRVPPHFAGSIGDNFITRAFKHVDFNLYFEDLFTRHIINKL